MEKVISKNQIIAAIAYWGVIQSPYLFPKNLDAALLAVSNRIDEKHIFKSPKKGDFNSMIQTSEEKICLIINDLINKTPEIAIWNVTQAEQNAGIIDPLDKNRTIKFNAACRMGPMQSDDMSFIDLSALEHNVCKTLLYRELL